MTPYPEKGLVWIDVETPGLVAHAPNMLLLEVACLVTDLQLNVLDETGYQASLLWTRPAIDAARNAAAPFVQDMHDRTGLWDKCTDPERSQPQHVVNDELTAYIQNLIPEARTARCAGNSVRLDLNFLDQYLPSVTGHLHYRMLDVSSHAGPAQWWAGIEPMDKVRNHTAMADIRESIAEMRYLKERTYDRLPRLA